MRSADHGGVLHGEYLVLANGVLLLGRDGSVYACSLHNQFPPVAHGLWTDVQSPEIRSTLATFLDAWDRLPVAEDIAVIADTYPENYFHFSVDMMPRLRWFAAGRAAPSAAPRGRILIPAHAMAKPFQKDLLSRVSRGMTVLPFTNPVRVRDPFLTDERLNTDGILWLRHANGIIARPGRRRIFVRRAARGGRAAGRGSLSESDAFLGLLRDYGFETVDFGTGERTVAEQIAMLDGAGLILAPQGAGIANFAYLGTDIKLIEVIGGATQDAVLMHIATAVGFDYHGIYSSAVDGHGDIVVDLDELRGALSAAGIAAAASNTNIPDKAAS
jgi:capsular polysaccharide biosynthesis protein